MRGRRRFCPARGKACRSLLAEKPPAAPPTPFPRHASRLTSRGQSRPAYNRCGDYSMKIKAGFIVAGLLLYGASVTHPFHFDDALITNDSNVTNPEKWVHFLNPL